MYADICMCIYIYVTIYVYIIYKHVVLFCVQYNFVESAYPAGSFKATVVKIFPPGSPQAGCLAIQNARVMSHTHFVCTAVDIVLCLIVSLADPAPWRRRLKLRDLANAEAL